MKIISVLLFVILLCDASCQSQTVDSQQLEIQKQFSDKSIEIINLSDIQERKNVLTYGDYELEKQFKSHPDLTDKAKTVEYAVMHKLNKKVAKFDFIEHPLSVVNFGWFSFLDKNERQMLISQTAPRLGTHWIVNFEPKYQVIFNSSEFNVGGEDFIVVDLDKDNVYELSFVNYIALKLNSKTLAESVPSTEIIFKFNPKQNKYLPANPQFTNYLLHDINEEVTQIRRENQDAQFADVLNITLRYIYAGKEKEAWEFFDKTYNFGDKKVRENVIKSALQKDVIYKFLKKNYD